MKYSLLLLKSCETTDSITRKLIPLLQYCKACYLNVQNISGFKVYHLEQIVTEFSDITLWGRFLVRKALLMDLLIHAFMSSAMVSLVQWLINMQIASYEMQLYNTFMSSGFPLAIQLMRKCTLYTKQSLMCFSSIM